MLSELLLKKFPALLELLFQVPFPNTIFFFLGNHLASWMI